MKVEDACRSRHCFAPADCSPNTQEAACRGNRFFHRAFGGGGQGERSGSHPAALSEDVRATAWKPGALEARELDRNDGLVVRG
jgi:hypothetical protein